MWPIRRSLSSVPSCLDDDDRRQPATGNRASPETAPGTRLTVPDGPSALYFVTMKGQSVQHSSSLRTIS
ncbi:hypothetical protein ACS0PU_007950 [Formica fusca]